MSLNWKEINLVLSELPLAGGCIQNIVQVDYHFLYFECYANGETIWVQVCLQPGMTHINRCQAPPKTKGLQPRFCEFLRAHLKGGIIDSFTQYGQERIVILRINCLEGRLLLYIRLWSNAANILAVNEAGIILDALYRRPLKGEISGLPLILPTTRNGKDHDLNDQFRIREWPSENPGGFNAYIDQQYRITARELDFHGLKEKLERQIQTQIARHSARHTSLMRQLKLAANPDRYKQMGEIILAYKRSIAAGAANFETEDWNAPGTTIWIDLDPRLDPIANADRYFQKFQKARDGFTYIRQDLAVAEAAQSSLLNLQVALVSADSMSLLQQIDRNLAPFRETGSGQKAGIESDRPGLAYTSHGFLLLIGRNATENDALLRHHVRGNDFWLHVRDFSGGYVFIKVPRTKSVPLEVLVDAAHLAVWYSRAKGEPEVDLFYTQVKYLRRAKHGTYGMVIPTRERNLHVKIEPDRVATLQSDLNGKAQ